MCIGFQRQIPIYRNSSPQTMLQKLPVRRVVIKSVSPASSKYRRRRYHSPGNHCSIRNIYCHSCRPYMLLLNWYKQSPGGLRVDYLQMDLRDNFRLANPTSKEALMVWYEDLR